MAPVDSIKRNLLFRFGACLHTQQARRRPNAGPMLAHRLRRWPSIKPALVQRLVFAGLRSIQQTHLYNICTMRRRRWAGVVQMLYKCFVFAGNSSWSGGDYKLTPTRCLLNVGPASPVLASRHSVLMSTLFVTICNRLRPFAVVCDGLQTFAIVCDRLRSFATICDRL